MSSVKIAYLSTGNFKPMLKIEILNDKLIAKNKVKVKVIDPPSRLGDELEVDENDIVHLAK